MQKGVVNNHRGPIEITPAGVTLKPGLNELTSEQYEAIRKVPVIKSYFETGILADGKALRQPKKPAQAAAEASPQAEPEPPQEPATAAPEAPAEAAPDKGSKKRG